MTIRCPGRALVRHTGPLPRRGPIPKGVRGSTTQDVVRVARAFFGLREGPDLAVEVNDGLAAMRERAAEGARYDRRAQQLDPESLQRIANRPQIDPKIGIVVTCIISMSVRSPVKKVTSFSGIY